MGQPQIRIELAYTRGVHKIKAVCELQGHCCCWGRGAAASWEGGGTGGAASWGAGGGAGGSASWGGEEEGLLPHLHDGLQQPCPGLGHGLPEAPARRNLERERGRVDVVVGAIVERACDVDDGEAGQDTAAHHLLETLSEGKEEE